AIRRTSCRHWQEKVGGDSSNTRQDDTGSNVLKLSACYPARAKPLQSENNDRSGKCDQKIQREDDVQRPRLSRETPRRYGRAVNQQRRGQCEGSDTTGQEEDSAKKRLWRPSTLRGIFPHESKKRSWDYSCSGKGNTSPKIEVGSGLESCYANHPNGHEYGKRCEPSIDRARRSSKPDETSESEEKRYKRDKRRDWHRRSRLNPECRGSSRNGLPLDCASGQVPFVPAQCGSN